jgi:hypothetical protein
MRRMCVWMLVCISLVSVGIGEDDSRGSLVRVRASIQAYDQFRPWQKKSPFGLKAEPMHLLQNEVFLYISKYLE